MGSFPSRSRFFFLAVRLRGRSNLKWVPNNYSNFLENYLSRKGDEEGRWPLISYDVVQNMWRLKTSHPKSCSGYGTTFPCCQQMTIDNKFSRRETRMVQQSVLMKVDLFDTWQKHLSFSVDRHSTTNVVVSACVDRHSTTNVDCSFSVDRQNNERWFQVSATSNLGMYVIKKNVFVHIHLEYIFILKRSVFNNLIFNFICFSCRAAGHFRSRIIQCINVCDIKPWYVYNKQTTLLRFLFSISRSLMYLRLS